MRRVLLAVLLVAAALPVAAQGPGPSVSLSVHPPMPIANQPFDIVITINGTNVTSIKMPEAAGIEIGGSPYKQSTTMRNGAVTVQRAYRARIGRAGRFTLPAAEVIADGRAYASAPVTITVVEEPETAPPLPSDPGGRRDAGMRESRRTLSLEETAFLKAYTDKTVVYQGEAVLLTLELWTIDDPGIVVQTYANMPMTEPPITGFYVITAPGQRNFEREVDDLRYKVAASRRWLFPTGTGDFTIDSWQWNGRVQQGWPYGGRGSSVSPRTSPLNISVKPLPPRPNDFSGAVGSFDIAASVSSTDLIVGEPVTLTYTIAGEGNPEAISAPKLDALPGVHVTGPSVIDETDGSGDLLAVAKRFEYTLIPTLEGPLTIPGASFVYFDPEVEEYITKNATTFDLTVAPNPEGQHRVVADGGTFGAETVEVRAEGIRPNASMVRPLHPSGGGVAFAAALAAPALAYGAAAVWMARRRRFSRDARMARARFARGRGRKRLAAVHHAADPAEALYKALIGFVADKAHVPEEGLTSADVGALLEPYGDADMLDSIVKTLRACERARYGGAALSGPEVGALIDSAAVNMDRIESAIRTAKEARV